MTRLSLAGHALRPAVAALVLASVGCSDSVSPTAQRSVTPSPITPASAERTIKEASGGIGLVFDGSDANASTPLGTVVTTQTDNIAIDLPIRYDGPNAANGNQMIYMNGHGAFSGWGIIVVGSANGDPDGSLAIIESGIDVPLTPFVLKPGVLYNLYVERRAGVVTVALDGQVYNMGYLPVNPVGQDHASIERTSLGGDGTFDAPTGDFHGAVGPVGLFDLTQNRLIELWTMSEGHGTTTTGVFGTVLHIGNATWLHFNGL